MVHFHLLLIFLTILNFCNLLHCFPINDYFTGDDEKEGLPVQRVIHETLYITQGTLWTDGNPRENSVLINGTYPGPELRFRVGDLALIKVFNHLPNQNTTIHFHGISQSLLPASDGTPMVSQWPIAPFNFFEYQIHFTKSDVGTTFYHSHVGAQIMSAHGAFIVTGDEEELSTIPKGTKEKTMLVGDYFYANDTTIINDVLLDPFVWPGSAASISLNGKSWRVAGGCNATIATRKGLNCDQSNYKGPEVIDVEYNQPYRLRWIGAQTLMHLAISIFGHSQNIIAADGKHIQPINTTFIEIMGGQRYDTILKTKTKEEVKEEQKGGCYPIRFETRWRTPATNGWAMLRYPNSTCNVSIDAPFPQNNTATYLPPQQFGWISDQFHPLKGSKHIAPSDKEVSRRVILQAQQVAISPGKTPALRWDVNKNAYNESDPRTNDNKVTVQTPYLIQLFKGEKLMPNYERGLHPTSSDIQPGFDELSNTYVGKAGEVIDVVIINNGSAVNHVTETHPWHFHGAAHYTVAMGIGEFTEEAFTKAKKQFYPAIARDTTGVWPGLGASINVPAVLLANNTSGAWSVLRYKVPVDDSASGVW
ncbi:hypothetical protein L7F22_043907 [Adiantum nelumboides]|nr:hypothetical protein [Adiantum nelumboides]